MTIMSQKLMYTIIRRRVIQISLSALCIISLAVPLVGAGQGFYAGDNEVRSGMLVSLTKNPGVVEMASANNQENLVGVVGTSSTDFAVQKDQIAVQTEGVVPALVSTANGEILVGDKIGPSALNGIGTKVGTKGWIVGVAQGSLTSDTQGAVKTTITDENGKSREVHVAIIPVLINGRLLSVISATFGSLQVTGTANIATLNISGEATI